MSDAFDDSLPPAPTAKRGKTTKIVVDDRPLWKKKRFLIPVGLVVLMIGAAAVGGGGSGSSSSGGVAVADQTRQSITFDEIVSRSDDQTDAQWEKFADELKDGYRADNWVGYVIDVREQAFGDDYYVQLSTDPDGILSDFNKDLSADEALALSKGDRLVVSGDIKNAFRIGTVSIELAK